MHLPQPIPLLLAVALLPSLLLLAAAISSYCIYGTTAALIGILEGRALLPVPATRDIGTIAGGVRITATFRLLNLTSRPITVIGAELCCGTRLMRSTPFTIGARESETIEYSIYAPRVDSITTFERQSALYTDCDTSPIAIRVQGTLLPPEPHDQHQKH